MNLSRTTLVLGICVGLMACSSNNPTNSDAGSDAGWTGIGGDGGEVSSGAFYGRIAAGNGTVFVAFADDNVNDQLTVMSSSGGAWAPVGVPGFSGVSIDATNLALTIDSAGAPWVAFSATDANSGNTMVTVMKFSGGSWVTQGASAFAQTSAGLTLVVAGGAPYVSLMDSGAHVMTLTGSTWTEVGGFAADASIVTTPTLGTDGTSVYLAYDDYVAAQMVLAKLGGTTWTTLATSPVMIEEDWGASVNVSKGSVFVGYENFTNGPVVMQLVGGSLQSIGALGSIANGDSVEAVSTTVYDGVPYVAFDDESRDGDPDPRAATVKYWDGSNWTLYAGYPNPCDIEDTVLTTDVTTGRLYLTYEDCNGFMAVDVR